MFSPVESNEKLDLLAVTKHTPSSTLMGNLYPNTSSPPNHGDLALDNNSNSHSSTGTALSTAQYQGKHGTLAVCSYTAEIMGSL